MSDIIFYLWRWYFVYLFPILTWIIYIQNIDSHNVLSSIKYEMWFSVVIPLIIFMLDLTSLSGNFNLCYELYLFTWILFFMIFTTSIEIFKLLSYVLYFVQWIFEISSVNDTAKFINIYIKFFQFTNIFK